MKHYFSIHKTSFPIFKLQSLSAVGFGFLGVIVLLMSGCKKPISAGRNDSEKATPRVSARPAKIDANPNPVPPGEGGGTTTITWDTGTDDPGEVYVVDAGEEKRFSEGATGSSDVPWIMSGGSYEFRLYEGKAHAKVLGTVVVTRPKKE